MTEQGIRRPWAEVVESSIPKRYKKAQYEDVPTEIQKAFESISDGKGLYLWGDVGTGKTHIAYALHKSAPKSGVRSDFVNTVELFKELREDISREQKVRPVDRLMKYEGVIILDDMGVEKATDFVVEALYLLVNYRYNNHFPMIITSNYSLDGLADRLGDRIPSRIAEMCNVFPLQGVDRRLKR